MECKEIVSNFTSKDRRIGMICGAQGIGKTAVAVQVGHMLFSEGWHVHYHPSKDQDASLEISGFLSAQAVSEISHFTLFILDNVDIYNEPDGQDKMRNVFQSSVESVAENGYVGLLFVTREAMHFLKNIAFSFTLPPFSSTFAVELLNTASRNIPVGDLNAIAETCDNIPHTLMVARGLIEDGMSATDIINSISSSDKFRMGKVNKLEDTSSSKREKSSLVALYSNPLHLPCHEHEMFTPKEVACLKKKPGSFHAGRSMPLYRNTEQTIYNIIERLDGPPGLDFLEEPTDGMFLFKGALSRILTDF